MLSAYILTVDIVTHNPTFTEEEFRQLVAPSLAHLDHLKRAFDRSPSRQMFYPPAIENGKLGWSCRGIVLVSIGKERGSALLDLYMSIASLILLELPDFEISAHADVTKFS